MTIFAVLMPAVQPALVAEIKRLFPADHIELNETQILVSTSGTAVDLSAKIGIYDVRNPNKSATGSAVILASSSYYGRAPTNVWEWMKAKLESPPSG